MPEKSTKRNKVYKKTKKFSRRQMLVFLAGGLLSVGGIITFILENGTKLSIIFAEGTKNYLDNNDIAFISKIINEYTNKYGKSASNITINILDHSSQNQSFSNGSSIIVLEDASPGKINLDISLIKNKDLINRTVEIRETLEHSMTHANQLGGFYTFPQSFLLKDGSTAIQGFSIYVLTIKGENTAFRKIEEGTCEALAKNLDDSYKISEPHYFALGDLTLKIMKLKSITPEHLSNLIQNNNLLEYIRILLNKTSISLVTSTDIELVMGWYQRAWDFGNTSSDGSIGMDTKVQGLIQEIELYTQSSQNNDRVTYNYNIDAFNPHNKVIIEG